MVMPNRSTEWRLMHTLRELQAEFRQALLGGGVAALGGLIREDGLLTDARLDIYRNNVFVSLKQVLKDTFPVVCRLVDERFFVYATDEFIRSNPPEQACLFAYGDRFADFLAGFPPCRELVYLPDVARLEWLLNVAAHAAESAPISPAELNSVAEGDAPNLVFRLDPSLGFLDSSWPVDRIWYANQSDANAEAVIDLDMTGTKLEVRRTGGHELFRRLDPATFVLRSMLAAGHRLEVATEAALAADPCFEFTAAFGNLFTSGSIVGWTIASLPAQRIE
jgi:hypothetical protein